MELEIMPQTFDRVAETRHDLLSETTRRPKSTSAEEIQR